jgi:hypothetical protein
MKRVVYDISGMTRVEWMGITILEPVTVLTNLMITAVCIYAFVKIGRLEEKNHVRKLLRYFFLFMALATSIGGILGHGFLYLTGIFGKLPGWYASMLAVAFIERAAIVHSRPIMHSNLGKFFSILNYLEVSTFIILTFITVNFRFVEAHATYGLFVVVFCFELYTYIKKKDRGSWMIFIGTSLAAIASLTHLFKLSLHEWFNYNDVSHVFMACAIYYYYLGAVNLKMYEHGPDQLVPKAAVS